MFFASQRRINNKFMSKTIILIPSRLSASRLPGKPLLKINGMTLINHVYKKAIDTKIGEVYVTTGDIKIYENVKNNGGNSILTKKNHSTGTDRIYEGLQLLKKKNIDYVLNLQGDEPLISINDIKLLKKKIIEGNYQMGTLACKLKNNELYNKNIVKVATDNTLEKKKISKAINFFRKNKFNNPHIYHHIGIYLYKYSTLKKIVSLKKTFSEKKLKLEQLRALDNNIPIHTVFAKNKPIGVDTIEDFRKVKKLLE